MASAPRTLSKGTLGLKFMNRQTTASPAPSSPAASTSAAAAPAPSSRPAPAVHERPVPSTSATSSQPDLPDHLTHWTGETSTGKTHITYSSSLLAFPLLSSASRASSSTTINGRQSFGGANKDLEPDRNASTSKSASKKQDRKRKGVDLSQGARDRTGNSTSAAVKPKKAKMDQQRDEAFKRPAGFEGAKKRRKSDQHTTVESSVRPSQDPTVRKGNRTKGKDRDPEDIQYKARGQARDWDAGKDDEDEDSSDEHLDGWSSSGSESSADDEEEVAVALARREPSPPVIVKKRKEKARKRK